MRYVAGAAVTTLAAGLLALPASSAYGALPHGDAPVQLTAGGGPFGLSTGEFVQVPGTQRAVFVTDDDVHGEELWVTDGTPAGTRLLADIVEGPSSSFPGELVAFGSRVVFVAGDDLDAPTELWLTDGTAAGTEQVLDIDPAVSSEPRNLAVAGGRVWFSAFTTADGRELWSSDGTAAGTALVADLVDGASSSFPQGFTAFAGRVWFSATTPATGTELFVSDGTEAGTALFRNFNPADAGGSPSGLTVLGSRLLMTATDGVSRKVWATDGSPGSMVELTDETLPRGRTTFTVAGGLAYFAAGQSITTGVELWATDGTPQGTSRVRDIEPDEGVGSNPQFITALGDRVLFAASAEGQGSALFVSDGTEAGTALVKATVPDGDSLVNGLRVVNGRAYFGARTVAEGIEPWRSDGTTAGTRPVGDLWPGPEFSEPFGFSPAGNTVLFNAIVGETADPEDPGAGLVPTRQLFAFNTQPSSTVLRPKASYSAKQARLKRIRVPVVVRAGGFAVDGPVVLRKGTKVVGRGRVDDGRGSVRIAVRLAVGRHRVTATYGGSLDARRSASRAVVIRVVR